MEKGTLVTTATSSAPGTEMVRTASPATSVEEITPQRNKRQQTRDKQKKKADSRSSSIWDDAGVALAWAQDTFTIEEMKVLSGVSTDEDVGRHLHKLVQVLVQTYLFPLCFFFFSFWCECCPEV